MIDPAVLDAMVASGCTAEQIAAVVKAALSANEEKKAEKRAGNADRQRRFRERNKSNALHVVTGVCNGDTVSPKKETSPTPPKEKTIPSISLSEARAEFDQFWVIFPNKVGKSAAEKSFNAARKRADLESILAGVRRYAAKTDDRPWCNPTTFLNQDRWNDQPATVATRSASPPKPRTIGDIFRDDAKQMGLIPDDQPTSTIDGHLDAGHGSRESGGTGLARRFAVSGDFLGRIG